METGYSPWLQWPLGHSVSTMTCNPGHQKWERATREHPSYIGRIEAISKKAAKELQKIFTSRNTRSVGSSWFPFCRQSGIWSPFSKASCALQLFFPAINTGKLYFDISWTPPVSHALSLWIWFSLHWSPTWGDDLIPGLPDWSHEVQMDFARQKPKSILWSLIHIPTLPHPRSFQPQTQKVL